MIKNWNYVFVILALQHSLLEFYFKCEVKMSSFKMKEQNRSQT